MTCGTTRSHLTSHSQRLRWPSSSPSTRSGYRDGAACSFMARTPLTTGMSAPAAPTSKVSRESPRRCYERERRSRRGGSDPVPGSRSAARDLLLRFSVLASKPSARHSPSPSKRRFRNANSTRTNHEEPRARRRRGHRRAGPIRPPPAGVRFPAGPRPPDVWRGRQRPLRHAAQLQSSAQGEDHADLGALPGGSGTDRHLVAHCGHDRQAEAGARRVGARGHADAAVGHDHLDAPGACRC